MTQAPPGTRKPLTAKAAKMKDPVHVKGIGVMEREQATRLFPDSEHVTTRLYREESKNDFELVENVTIEDLMFEMDELFTTKVILEGNVDTKEIEDFISTHKQPDNLTTNKKYLFLNVVFNPHLQAILYKGFNKPQTLVKFNGSRATFDINGKLKTFPYSNLKVKDSFIMSLLFSTKSDIEQFETLVRLKFGGKYQIVKNRLDENFESMNHWDVFIGGNLVETFETKTEAKEYLEEAMKPTHPEDMNIQRGPTQVEMEKAQQHVATKHDPGHKIVGLTVSLNGKTQVKSAVTQTSVVGEPVKKPMMKEEYHRVAVTVSDPNHSAVTMRREKQQKTARLSATDKDHAMRKAKLIYQNRGYKVHDVNHIEQLKESKFKVPVEYGPTGADVKYHEVTAKNAERAGQLAIKKHRKENPSHSPMVSFENIRTIKEAVETKIQLTEGMREVEDQLKRHAQRRIDHEKEYGHMNPHEIVSHELIRKQLMTKLSKQRSLANKKFMNESVDTNIQMTMPLFIRIMEWAREEAKDDVDLHQLAEKLAAVNGVADMDDYSGLI
jgi:hypothetical protein